MADKILDRILENVTGGIQNTSSVQSSSSTGKAFDIREDSSLSMDNSVDSSTDNSMQSVFNFHVKNTVDDESEEFNWAKTFFKSDKNS